MYTVLLYLLLLVAVSGGAINVCRPGAIDLGFVLDSSGSVGDFYQHERDFIKDIAKSFYNRSADTRAGVVTFSSRAEYSIKLGQYDSVATFSNAVDAISFMSQGTRIDLGLTVARDDMFTYTEFGRDNVQKLLVLLTDGITSGSDPAPIAKEMRKQGTMIVVISIGSNIDEGGLKKISGEQNYFAASSFSELVTRQFLNDIADASCSSLYAPAPDGKFYKLYNESRSWNDSLKVCEDEGSHLVIDDSPSTHHFMTKAYGSETFWLAAVYNVGLRKWIWIDGQVADISHLGDVQAHNGTNICLSSREGRWYYAACNSNITFLCQKGVTKPKAPTVSYDVLNNRFKFKCEFTQKKLTIPSTYDVTWFTSTSSRSSMGIYNETIRNGNVNVSYLPDKDGRALYPLGVNILCKVRTWYTNEPNTKSQHAASNIVFAGLKFEPTTVTLYEGGQSELLRVTLTVPILCKKGSSSCNVTIILEPPSNDIIIRPCYLVFYATSNGTFETKLVTLMAKRDVVDNGVTKSILKPGVLPDASSDDDWGNHVQPNIHVSRISVSTGRCTSTGLSHIRTFDGMYFNHYHVGDYLLVESKSRSFQIHVRTQSCGRVSCNCGVVVKEGDDVLSINMCGRHIFPEIRYLSNGEPQKGTYIEQSPNGKTFNLKFKSTAFVKFSARPWGSMYYADITVQLPPDDYNNTIGLCGLVDKDSGNDMMDKNGTTYGNCGSQACTGFTESWKISTKESLFCYKGGRRTCLPKSLHTVDEKTKWIIDRYQAKCSFEDDHEEKVTRGYKKMVFPGQIQCDLQRNVTTDDVIVLPEDTEDGSCEHEEDVKVVPIVPTFPTPKGRTEKEANNHCRNEIEDSKIYKACKAEIGHSFSVTGFIKQCVADIQILDDKVVALQSAIGAMTSICEGIAIRNISINGTNVLDNMCPNECSKNGDCEKGSCICDDGFATEDCSVPTDQVPELGNVTFGLLCDVRKSACAKVRVRSNNLVPGNIVCGMSWRNNFFVKVAVMLNFAEVTCELPGRGNVITNRYFAENDAIPTQRYEISISNNGKNFSDGVLPVIVYDSKCMVCSNSTTFGGTTTSCRLKDNTCLIKGYCYESGEVDANNEVCKVCDPERSTSKFAVREDSPDECESNRIFNVQCSESSMTAVWETIVFRKAPLEITLNDRSCNHYGRNGTHIWISTNFTDCNSTIDERGNFIYQENAADVTVLSHVTKVIRRKITYRYHMRCIFDRLLHISTENAFNATTEIVQVTYGNGSANFEANIAMYASSSFLQVLTRHPVKVTSFQPIFVGIKANSNEHLKLIVNQCFASTFSAPQTVRYMFLDMKCPLDKTFQIISSSNTHFHFRIAAFTFIQVRKSIRIHCRLFICKTDSTSPSCQQQCANERKRRDVTGDSDIPPVDEVSVITDEIVYLKQRLCEETVCPSGSSCLELYPSECRCNEGYVKEIKTGLCRKDRVVKVRDVHLQMPYLSTYDDPMSMDYLRLVTDTKKRLLTSLPLDEKIEGLKVVSVRNGSVILDVALIYAEHSSKEESFVLFVNSITTYANTFNVSQSEGLNIKLDMIPTMELERDEGKEVEELVVVVAVMVIFVLVIALGIGCKHSGCRTKSEGEIRGIENDGIHMDEVKNCRLVRADLKM